jgi:hypothetical protein
MSPADAGRALAREHAERHPLTDQQVADAARIFAAVARERAQEAA